MGRCKNDLLLTYSSEVQNGEPLLLSSNCLPVKAYNLEPAGYSFHSAALKFLGFCNEDEVESDPESVPSEDRSQEDGPSSDSYSSKNKKKSSAGRKKKDYYALLGLGHLRFLATVEQIRKGYRETALKHHPDKQSTLVLAQVTEEARQAKKDEIDNHFKTIQEAYEVLADPVKRRIYDSTDEFDDHIPSNCAPQDFFKVFGPAFMRNGRWSVNQPVPSLGDETSPIEDVDKFYNFWYTFKSWREFPGADEFDLEQAESRDHKRWMERQNSKSRVLLRKEELARIRNLVDNAYKRDPRIIRRKEEEKANKKKKKQEKFMARKLQEEAAARAAEEERRQKEEQERKISEAALNQKKMREKEKKLLRKERNRLRALAEQVVSENLLDVSKDLVEGICMSFELEKLRLLCDNMQDKEKMDKAKLLRDAQFANSSDASKHGDNAMQSNGRPDPIAKPGGTAAEAKMSDLVSNFEKKETPWDKEEIEMLRKGMQKYPKGTSRRWEVISEYIGTGRSVEEILRATKTVLQKPDSGKAFDSFLEKRKPVQTISSPLSMRGEAEAPAVVVSHASGTSLVQSTGTDVPNRKPAEVQASNGASSAAEQDTWSETQERAFVQALKTFSKDASQRWERIAAAVPGKNMIQCKKKFSLMKETFRSKKNAKQ